MQGFLRSSQEEIRESNNVDDSFNDVNSVELNVSSSSFNSSFSNVQSSSSSSFLVVTILISPNSTPINNANLLVAINRAIELQYSHYLFFGEFNYKKIDWINCESTVGEEHSAAKFFNCIQDNNLFQHVKSPIRFREGQNPSFLDLVFTNEENMIASSSLVIDSPIGKSDHAVIHFDYNCYLSFEQDPSERFQYFKCDYKAISDELDQENWDVLFEDQSIEQIWNILKTKLSQCIEK
ncbi:Hypothetical predicted protein [Mytilus galloprovincialis]|uniref:Endonuclease/exonuclease/phosphatase domain-containing protein n=1 Tax=Mytilus galloprovincialis TaxID=29158 RepID=A0A8B6DBB0_MYTGA|nr:Hypothetical predicted protein [Mytilus galloprovincialis]